MQLKIHIPEKEYLHYAYMNLRRWKKYNWSFVLVTLTAIWAIVMIIASLVSKQTIDSNVSIVVLLLVIIYFSMRIFFTNRIKKEYRSNPLLQQEINYTLDENGLSTQTKASRSNIEWEKVLKVRQSKKILAIYISNDQAYIFPKDQLLQEQKEELLNLLKTHLPISKFIYTTIK